MISRFLLAGRGKITTKPLLSCASNLSRKDNIALSLSWRTIHTTHLRQLEHNEKPVAGPTQPPTSPSNNLKRPVSSTNSEHTKKPSQKPETEEGEEYQTPIPAPLNIPGAGVPGFGLSFRSGASFDAALTTVVGLALVFLGGVVYVTWYKARVLDKIEEAFAAGYDPALHLADQVNSRKRTTYGEDGSKVLVETWDPHLKRKEQELIDALINGTEQGYYYLIMGSKGTGKQTMILDAMRKIDAEGVAIVEAHSDLEVFRLRLGKAINFEFNEDSQTGLFQRRDPREGGPRLDIERALNKLEKVALKVSAIRKKPLVLVLNNAHLFANNEDSVLLLLQLQQRAEAWAESGILTLVFSTDDYWPYPLLRKNGNRFQVLSIYDLNPRESLSALRRLRQKMKGHVEEDHILEQALQDIGGRLSYMARAGRSNDILEAAKNMRENEKAWLLSRIGLIPDCDDDVMDEQKAQEEEYLRLKEAGESPPELTAPTISYYEARQIMTRPDFLEFLDTINIVAIDAHHVVRPDSTLMLRAAREVVEEEGFEELLTNVRERIDEIEGLHRTRELIWKTSEEGDTLKIVVEDGKKQSRIY